MSAWTAAWLAAMCLGAAVWFMMLRRHGWPVEPSMTREAPRPALVARSAAASPALVADAAAALIGSGASVPRTLECLGAPDGPAPELAVVARMLAWGADDEQAWGCAPEHEGLRAAVALAETTGAPVAAVLSRRAQEQRRSTARDEEARAASLAVRLVVPMGLCGLPAFICLGVVPIGLALAPL
jgi:pilus assembly protein TadC